MNMSENKHTGKVISIRAVSAATKQLAHSVMSVDAVLNDSISRIQNHDFYTRQARRRAQWITETGRYRRKK